MKIADGSKPHEGQRVHVIYGVFAGSAGEVYAVNENNGNILVALDGRSGGLGFLRTELAEDR